MTCVKMRIEKVTGDKPYVRIRIERMSVAKRYVRMRIENIALDTPHVIV